MTLIMKVYTSNKRLLGSLLILLAMCGISAWGQPDNRERPPLRPRVGGGDRFAPDGQFQERPRQGANAAALSPVVRVLTPEQRRSFREAMMDEREKLRELNEELRAARSELLEAGLAENASDRRIRAKARRVSELQTELMVLTTRAISRISPPLSPEQIEGIKNPPPPRLRDTDSERRQRFRGGDPQVPRDAGRPGERPRGGRPPLDRDAPNPPPRPFPED